MNRTGIAEPRSWSEVFASVTRKETLIMLLLGFVAGLPILLIFSSLSLWLREAGLSRGLVTYFSWAALGYSFKFAWAPLIDRLPVPFLTQYLGRRRSWLLVAQAAVIAAIAGMAYADSLRVAVPLFLVHIISVPLIIFNIDVFLEEKIGNDFSPVIRSYLLLAYAINIRN